MSGGHFEYNDRHALNMVIDKMQKLIDDLKSHINGDDNGEFNGYYENPKAVLEEYEKTMLMVKEAQIRLHRIDWFESADDGEDTFFKQLKKELEEFKRDG